MPQIAYHFVDKNTVFLYKKYRKNREDNTAYFEAAYNSMKTKGAQLIDLTDEQYEFDFGEMHFELINTNIHKKEEKSGENQNSIASIITYKNKRLYLAADLEIADDLIYKDKIGKVDLMKISHHGFGDNSFEIYNTTRPAYTIISHHKFDSYSIVPTAFLQQKCGGKVFLTGNVAKSSVDAANSAIRAYLIEDISDTSEETRYHIYMENTGDNIDIGTDLNGLKTYQHYTFYFEKGKIITALQTIEREDGECQCYFVEDGYMLTDACAIVDDEELCFDKNGCLEE